MRRLIAFPCAGETLLGSLDAASGTTGLLIVSGGNEIRAGAHRGMAMLAGRLAAGGVPVFRYDRRGVGDSTGENTGYAGARDDLIAAAATFRAEAPQITRIAGFGNCDGATTLALWGREAGLDAVVLANPWTVEPAGDLPPPAAIRAHYRARLRDPGAWWRMVRGGVSPRRLLGALRGAARTPAAGLSARVLAALDGWANDATVVLARGDHTAIAYADAARRSGLRPHTIAIDTDSHSFARPGDAEALEEAIRAALARCGPPEADS